MRTNRKILLIVVTLVIAFAGCKKYSDGPTISLMPKKWRLDGTWKVASYVVNGVTTSSTSTETCQFKGNKDYIYTSGAFSVSGTWAWGDKKESVKVTIMGTTEESKILRLTNKELWTQDINSTTQDEVHYIPSK